jgi:hypothetical protein
MIDDFNDECFDSVPCSIFAEYEEAVDCDDDDDGDGYKPKIHITQSIQRAYKIPPATMRVLFIMRFQLIDKGMSRTWLIK